MSPSFKSSAIRGRATVRSPVVKLLAVVIPVRDANITAVGLFEGVEVLTLFCSILVTWEPATRGTELGSDRSNVGTTSFSLP